MKLKQLESCLQSVKSFERPKIHLEQYQTTPHLAARILFSQSDDLVDRHIVDLGCGSGIFTIGPLYLGASHVTAIDIDNDALSICQDNLREAFNDNEDEDCNISCDLILADVSSDLLPGRFFKSADTVIMNPPFGTRNSGIDMVFLDKAFEISTDVVFSLHKSSTRDFIKRRIEKLKGHDVKMEVLAELRFNLPATYQFHKRKSIDVEVDFIKFNYV